MALNVVSHNPTINSTGVYRNTSISVIFNERIRPSTVDANSFTVNDHSTFTSVPGTYSMEYDTSGNALTAVFTPSINLTANTKYDVYVYGLPDSVLTYENEGLDETYTFSFTTGMNIYDNGTSSGTLPEDETSTVYSGILYNIPPSATGNINSFIVYYTSPRHQEPHICINMTGIAITFTGVISTSLSDMSGYISIEETPVIG